MKRKDGWEKIFYEHIEEHLHLKRNWETNNCCFFVVDWISMATGVDTSSSYSWNFKTRKEAYELLDEFAGGFDEAIDKLTKEFEMPECPVLMARRGDIGVVPTQIGNALGIIGPTGRHLLVQGLDGLDEIPISYVLKTWRVG